MYAIIRFYTLQLYPRIFGYGLMYAIIRFYTLQLFHVSLAMAWRIILLGFIPYNYSTYLWLWLDVCYY